MQSSQQSSVKLQAHHDKIANEVGNATKINFMRQELTFLLAFKQHAETLQLLARPTEDPPTQLLKLERRIARERHDLAQEVILIRRARALLEIEDGFKFQSQIGQHYEQAVGKLDTQMQSMQVLVQQREQDKKSSNRTINNVNTAFKSEEHRQITEQFLQIRERVKLQMKKHLLLASQAIKLEEEQRSNLLANCKREGISYHRYHFLDRHQPLYPSKSNDKSQYPPITSFSPIKSPKKRTQRHKYSKKLLSVLQTELLQQSLQSLRQRNAKMQASIETLKAAIAAKNNQTLSNILQKDTQLDLQQVVTREFIAYHSMSHFMPDRLGACSFLWANKDRIHEPNHLSKEWDQTNYRAKFVVFRKKRPKSADRQQLSQTAVSFLNEHSKGTQKTNSSNEGITN